MKEGQSNQALSVMGKADVQKSDSEVGRSTPREREHRSAGKGGISAQAQEFRYQSPGLSTHPCFPVSSLFRGSTSGIKSMSTCSRPRVGLLDLFYT